MFGLFNPFSLAGPSRLFTRGFSSTPIAQKLKSHSGSKKRFTMIAGGAFKRGQAGKRHLNTSFAPGHINRLAQTTTTSKTQSKKLRKLLPYAK